MKKKHIILALIFLFLISIPAYADEAKHIKYEGPALEIVYPRNGFLSLDNKITITGLSQFVNRLQINDKIVGFKEDSTYEFSAFNIKVNLKNLGLNVVEIYYEDIDKKVHKQTLDIYWEPMPKGREQILIGPEKYLSEYPDYKEDSERDVF